MRAQRLVALMRQDASPERYLYPGWICRLYVDETAPRRCIRQARDMGADVIRMPKQTDLLQGHSDDCS